jgi:hypothetical protein
MPPPSKSLPASVAATTNSSCETASGRQPCIPFLPDKAGPVGLGSSGNVPDGWKPILGGAQYSVHDEQDVHVPTTHLTGMDATGATDHMEATATASMAPGECASTAVHSESFFSSSWEVTRPRSMPPLLSNFKLDLRIDHFVVGNKFVRRNFVDPMVHNLADAGLIDS